MGSGATGSGWQGAVKWLGRTKKRLPTSFEPVRRAIYEAAAKEARQIINTGQVAPSSDQSPTLLKTGDYVRAIGVHGKGDKMHVGFPEGGTHGPSGLPFDVIWRVHEFGNRRQPARPHLVPAVKAAKKMIPQILAKAGFKTDKGSQ